jgi:hypothetical protein
MIQETEIIKSFKMVDGIRVDTSQIHIVFDDGSIVNLDEKELKDAYLPAEEWIALNPE